MDALLDEIESLEAILMDDVHITRNSKSGFPELIETTILPVVGEEDEQQYVCVTLQVFPSTIYPDESPKFKLLKPRGLDDQRLEQIRTACVLKLEELKGCPVVFDLIETIRELLTGSNLPSGQCVVCLYGFTDGDEFARTECFHFLHSYCLSRHLNAMRRTYQEEYEKLPSWLQQTAEPFKPLCPVCREVIKDESDSVKCAMPPAELENAPTFQLTNELRELQQRMATLYLQQKERGGIIDVEAEKATVISIETEQELRRRLAREHNAANRMCDVVDAAQVSSRQQDTTVAVIDFTAIKPSSSRQNAQTQSKLGKEQAEMDECQPALHNKRYGRGGRRHHYHQHHHRESRSERERERFEYAHGITSNMKTENVTNAKSVSNKQTKAQTLGMSVNR